MSAGAGYIPAPSNTPCVGFTGTRAQVLALRAANSLPVNCAVVITDWVQGTTLTGPNLVRLQPVNASTLPLDADVFTPFDNIEWSGQYDIDNVSNPTGTMIRLTDTLGNTAQDIATGATVGQFPWGSAIFRNNYVQDSTLTGWATQAGAWNGNRVKNSVVDLTGKTAGNVTDSVIDGVTNFQASGTFSAVRSTFQGGVVTKLGPWPTTITDSEFLGGTFNVAAGVGAGVCLITRVRATGSTITKTVQGLGSNNLVLADSEILASVVSSAGGTISVTNSTLLNSNYVVADRGLAAVGLIMNGGNVNQARTNVTNTDTMNNCTISAGSQFNLTGATDGGGTGAVYNGVEVVANSIFSCDAPFNGQQAGNLRVAGGSTLALQGAAARAFRVRVDAGSSLTLVGVAVSDSIQELSPSPIVTSLAQSNRLRNKSFDDWG